jgi:hypothetical protein
LDSVCKKLEDAGFADDDWDPNNLVESSYKEQGLKRYKTLVTLMLLNSDFGSYVLEVTLGRHQPTGLPYRPGLHNARVDVNGLGSIMDKVTDSDAMPLLQVFVRGAVLLAGAELLQ